MSSTVIQVGQLYMHKLQFISWTSQSHTTKCCAPPLPGEGTTDGGSNKYAENSSDDDGEVHTQAQERLLANLLYI